MLNNNFQNLIDNNKSQIFICKSRAHFPFIFAIHLWIMINKRGELSRWEVAYSKKFKAEKSWGYLYKNLLPLFQGLSVFTFLKKLTYESRIIGLVEGDIATHMISFIEEMPNNYKYLNKYKLLGPNSNTFVNYVINKFPESKLKLPWNAIGKNYE